MQKSLSCKHFVIPAALVGGCSPSLELLLVPSKSSAGNRIVSMSLSGLRARHKISNWASSSLVRLQ